MKVVILTSTSLRHKYIANKVAEKLSVELIITEKKSPKIEETKTYDEETQLFIKNHFDQRLESEKVFFGGFKKFPSESKFLEVEHNQINSLAVFDEVKKINPEIILLFGTSIIKKPLLDSFEGKIINLHLGLSPYYKGSATNLFPVLYNELECIGATIHLATNQVDQGNIIAQIRPDLLLEDSLHDIGNRVIFKSGEVLPTIIKLYAENKVKLTKQTEIGRICRIKDLTPNVLREIYFNFNNGLKKEYLLNKIEKQILKPICNLDII